MGKGDDRRQLILARAAQTASRLGLEGLTIGQLASDLGLSKSGLFAHFQSKQALQVQTLRHTAELFVDRVVRPALKAPRGERRLRALFERWLAWAEADVLKGGCLFVAAATELDDLDGPARDELVRQLLAYHHARRLLRDPRAGQRARNAFDALVRAARPKHPARAPRARAS